MTTAKKQPVRVFLEQADHSRFLVQAGMNQNGRNRAVPISVDLYENLKNHGK